MGSDHLPSANWGGGREESVALFGVRGSGQGAGRARMIPMCASVISFNPYSLSPLRTRGKGGTKILRSEAKVPESVGELGPECKPLGPKSTLLPLKPKMGIHNPSATRAGDLPS